MKDVLGENFTLATGLNLFQSKLIQIFKNLIQTIFKIGFIPYFPFFCLRQPLLFISQNGFFKKCRFIVILNFLQQICILFIFGIILFIFVLRLAASKIFTH